MSVESAARIERERSYHDTRFAEDTRARVSQVYDVAAGATREYQAKASSATGSGRVLEYGCGVGSLASSLATQGAEVVGIDISPVAIEISAEEAQRDGFTAQFREMDAERLDFPDRSFDAVVGSGILHHLELAVAVPEVARLLKPAGRAVFYEPMGHNPLINAFRRFTPNLRTEDEHPLLVSDLRNLSASFGSVKITYHVLVALMAVPLTRFGRAGRLMAQVLACVDAAVFRLIPPARRFAWIVVLELAEPRRAATEA